MGKNSHMIRFVNPDYKLRELNPEMVIINGHTGRISFKAFSGFHVSICSNGLISGDIKSVIKAVHVEYSINLLSEMLGEMLDTATKLGDDIERYKIIEMTEIKTNKFVMDVHKMVWNKKSLIKPKDLLKVRRPEDDNNSLWSTFNRVQENIIKGGIEYEMHNATHEYKDISRPINSINRQTLINVGLWNLMTKYAK